jgi:hypothetical protein
MSPEDDFSQLAASNHLCCFGKMTFRRHQITTSRNWPGPGKSYYGVNKSREMTYRGLANSGLS